MAGTIKRDMFMNIAAALDTAGRASCMPSPVEIGVSDRFASLKIFSIAKLVLSHLAFFNNIVGSFCSLFMVVRRDKWWAQTND